MPEIASLANRETVADALAALLPENQSFLQLMMENPKSDEALLDGLHLYLNRAAGSTFLHSLKLQKCGEWIGKTAPARLQVRLSEASKSSQHPAFAAFKDGLQRSGGLARAYPKAPV
ncbi:hypothetical protein J2858_002138 [Neorhizobium galegae]|uniref:hypothetical protein n=1 Tax=Rhizobium/Agrobacterium group TaxID=227290 RepID=UPI001AE389BA|nr:hypothetical protein [Neorhizobium galegae]MBP2549215.1 hypothetical protein [Neorhizobium galegae]